MTDQLRLLPPFEWRGKQYPVTERNANFAHESVRHKLQRRNQDLIEQTGAHNFVFSYTIPMREDLFRGPYRHLFTEGLQPLLNDIRNREPGDLVDPILGLFVCVPNSYDDTSDPNKRDGTDIKVEFTHSPDDDGDDDIVVTLTGKAVAQESEAFEVAVAEFAVEANEAEEISPNTSVKLTDFLRELSTFGRAVLNTPNDAIAEMNRIVYWAAELEDIVSEASSPNVEAVRLRARTLREKAFRVLENAAQLNPVRTLFVETPRSLTSIAAELGVTVESLLKANQALARSPMVKPGTNVVIPDAKR